MANETKSETSSPTHQQIQNAFRSQFQRWNRWLVSSSCWSRHNWLNTTLTRFRRWNSSSSHNKNDVKAWSLSNVIVIKSYNHQPILVSPRFTLKIQVVKRASTPRLCSLNVKSEALINESWKLSTLTHNRSRRLCYTMVVCITMSNKRNRETFTWTDLISYRWWILDFVWFLLILQNPLGGKTIICRSAVRAHISTRSKHFLFYT